MFGAKMELVTLFLHLSKGARTFVSVNAPKIAGKENDV